MLSMCVFEYIFQRIKQFFKCLGRRVSRGQTYSNQPTTDDLSG